MTESDIVKSNSEELEPMRLVESKVALDLLERYRRAANNIGSIVLAKHISLEVAKIAGVRGTRISKSMIDSWRACRSSPTEEHLPSLQVFFRSRRFRRVVPEVEYLWNPLENTIKFGTQLRQWEGFLDSGSIADISGFWFDYDYLTADPGTFYDPDEWRSIGFYRIAAIPGHGFGVIHFTQAAIEGKIGQARGVGISYHWSGFVFRDDEGYIALTRDRMHRKRKLKFTIRRHELGRFPKGLLWLKMTDPEDPLLPRNLLPQNDPLYRPPGFPITRDAAHLPETLRKMFDSFLWSVLPHGIQK